ncbi:hypothetical protein [Blastococcus sp. CT_GayMR20]|nr:hypothetical protein [Blastococcus sp. CT_GayMR20]
MPASIRPIIGISDIEPARHPGPADDMPWGQRVAHIKDPDGNVPNLTQQL